MERINNTLFAHWNTDSSGNPISEQLSETQKVSPIHLCVQLNQIPDDFQGFEVRRGNTILSEVYDTQPIGQNNYKVDYGDGIVWIHSSRAGQEMQFNYSGRGYKTISAKRVMINDGDYIEQNTLQHLVDLNKQAVESVNNIQSNLDKIVEDARTYANNAIAHIEQYSSNTENKMAKAYSDLYAQMDSYVGEILKYKSQALSEMKSTLQQYKTESANATSDMRQAIRDFEENIEMRIAELERVYDNAIDEINGFLGQMREFVDGVQRDLALYASEQRQEMFRKTEEVETYKNSIKLQMKDKLDKLDEYVAERKESIDGILEHAQEISNDLEYIFKMQQLVWEGEFNDAQVERMEKFLESQTTKQNEFDLAQTNRDKDFIFTQEEQQSVFEENEAHREQIFEEMKNIAYDENAVLKNRKLINSKIDEIEF